MDYITDNVNNVALLESIGQSVSVWDVVVFYSMLGYMITFYVSVSPMFCMLSL